MGYMFTPKQRAAVSIAGNGLFILVVGGGLAYILFGVAGAVPALVIIALLIVIVVLLMRRR